MMKLILTVLTILILLLFAGLFFLALAGSHTARKILQEKPVLRTAEEAEARKEYCPLEEISEKCRKVFVGTEDSRFYRHHGTDWNAVWMAMVHNLRTGFWTTEVHNGKKIRMVYGASTITNQLARNLFLNHERSFRRKAAEFFVTREIEKQLSKDRILALYLNVICYGDDCFGIRPAAMHYYRILPSELGINQSASLQAIVKLPDSYHPLRNPKDFSDSRRFSLGSLAFNRVISEETKERLLKYPWDAPDAPDMECLPETDA